MKGVLRIDSDGGNAVHGRVIWSPAKSLWNAAMLLVTIACAIPTASAGAVIAFIVTTYLSLLFGHSIGMHRRSPLVDLFWQLNCRFQYGSAPTFSIEPEFANDRWYRFLNRTWMLQQLPVALLCFVIGGWGWVVWCVAARVSLSVVGHWSITY
jgi:hypothetical protein